MFALFYNLILALFKGQWVNYSLPTIMANLTTPFATLWKVICSPFVVFSPHVDGITDSFEVFNSVSSIADIPSNAMNDFFHTDYPFQIVAFILALIISIGIVMFAIKGIKRIFTIFFQGVR